jgi:sulfur carrier protein
MRVFLNGDPAELEAGATVEAVLEALELPAEGRGVAVAVDSEVVPRGRWSEHKLSEDARVEIVRAVQGG